MVQQQLLRASQKKTLFELMSEGLGIRIGIRIGVMHLLMEYAEMGQNPWYI